MVSGANDCTNHMRRCECDNGRGASRGCRSIKGSVRPIWGESDVASLAAINVAIWSMVMPSSRASSGMSTAQDALTREVICVAEMESPPKSMKLTCCGQSGCSRISTQIWVTGAINSGADLGVRGDNSMRAYFQQLATVAPVPVTPLSPVWSSVKLPQASLAMVPCGVACKVKPVVDRLVVGLAVVPPLAKAMA